MTILDSHCHAWRHWPYARVAPSLHAWGTGEALLAEMDAHDVEHAVVICARIGGGAGGDGWANGDNNDYAQELVAWQPSRFTAWIDVDCMWRTEYHTAGASLRLGEELDRYQSTGFTHYFAGRNDGWLRTPEAKDFFRAAAHRNVVASLSVGIDWLDDLGVIAQENPQLQILLHHLGSPRRGVHSDFSKITQFARHHNVGVKFSGFQHFATRPWDFPYAESISAARKLYDAYGPERLYWGSDFPASRSRLTYTQSIEVVRSHCGFISDAEMSQVMGENLRSLLKAAAR